MRITPVILILILVISAFLPACKERKEDVINTPSNPDSIATMVTRNVKTLISDSGMTKYRITSMIWYVYDEAKKPCWKFPKGLLLEKFDSDFKVEATIRCDSALYLKNERVWRLDGNVRISNVKRELIATEQIFWYQDLHEVRSDSFVHIEKSDRIIEGKGFRSDENLTNYLILSPSGIFPVPQNSNNSLQ